MYRKIIVLFFVGLTAFMVLPSTQADSGVIDIGTIRYGGFQNIMINRSYDVNLSLIYTPVVNDVAFQKLGFNPLTNSTVYYIQSLGIPIDYTFRNDSKPSLFQDSMGQVYRLFIDYHNVTVPPNPLFVPYVNLTMLYNKTLGELGRMNMSMGNLTLLMNVSAADWNASLSNWSSNYSTLNHQFIWMSLNASIDNNSARVSAWGKKNADDLIFRITIIIGPLIAFCCILVLYIAKRLRWFNPKEDRRIRKIESGYGPTSEKIDRFTVVKNDDVTNSKKAAMESTAEPRVEKTLVSSNHRKADLDKIHGSIDKLLS